jgi:xanthine dehydrogenase accessory factor
MPDSLTLLETLRGREPRVALATLVATKGSVPRGEGAKMVVGASGRVHGTVTIGGCVDARVLEESARVLADGRARRVVMELGDEDAMALGLTCGGSIELLVEPVEPARDGDPVLAAMRTLAAHAAADRDAVCVVRLDGARGRLVIGDDGSLAGTLGDPALDAGAVELAEESLRSATSRIGRVADAHGVELELFAERYARPETLVIFGASEVAVSLVPLAASLGWRTVVVDGRERWATRERFIDATEIRVGMLADVASELRYGARTAVVLVAHDYRFELPVLRAVLDTDAGYVGLLGNRRRVAALLEHLYTEGVPVSALERVHAPVGLDIGARTPAEIALAIIAEIIAVRRGRSGGALRTAIVAVPDGALAERVTGSRARA